MVNVNIKFNSKDYLLSCDAGQEDNLKELADFLDNKYLDLKKDLGNIGENKLLLISAIKIIDEFFDLMDSGTPMIATGHWNRDMCSAYSIENINMLSDETEYHAASRPHPKDL